LRHGIVITRHWAREQIAWFGIALHQIASVNDDDDANDAFSG
jgi:hypothetical protein